MMTYIKEMVRRFILQSRKQEDVESYRDTDDGGDDSTEDKISFLGLLVAPNIISFRIYF